MCIRDRRRAQCCFEIFECSFTFEEHIEITCVVRTDCRARIGRYHKIMVGPDKELFILRYSTRHEPAQLTFQQIVHWWLNLEKSHLQLHTIGHCLLYTSPSPRD